MEKKSKETNTDNEPVTDELYDNTQTEENEPIQTEDNEDELELTWLQKINQNSDQLTQTIQNLPTLVQKEITNQLAKLQPSNPTITPKTPQQTTTPNPQNPPLKSPEDDQKEVPIKKRIRLVLKKRR